MFDIGVFELFIVATLALIVLGPQRLPQVARTAGLWLGRLRRSYNNLKLEVEREVGMDEIRRQLHNEQIIAEVKAVEEEAKAFKDEAVSIMPGDEDLKNSDSQTNSEANDHSKNSKNSGGRSDVD